MKNKFLTINHLTKNYYNKNGEIQAIKDISFSLNNDEFIAIIGSSGCGKSTLLSILSGIEEKSSGEITYNKKNVKVGYMLQDDALFPWLTILNNALIGLDITKQKNEKNILYVKSLLKKYGLEKYLDKYPNQLSGGMRQRVALIRTLAIKPDILLLDEPFCSLDYMTRLSVSDDVYKIIKDQKIPTILVTHDLSEAISLADKVLILSKRPTVIKKIVEIKLTNKSNPIKNRKAKEFADYYELLWRALDKNE